MPPSAEIIYIPCISMTSPPGTKRCVQCHLICHTAALKMSGTGGQCCPAPHVPHLSDRWNDANSMLPFKSQSEREVVRFGPEALQTLDGEVRLESNINHGVSEGLRDGMPWTISNGH